MPQGTDPPSPTPIGQLPDHDYGAETLRNYRYQSAYAIVLLAAAAAKHLDYRAIWCEQEDDIVTEIDDHTFESCQVKTQKPELGPWMITDDAFVSSIKVFLGLLGKFPGQFRRFHFVSNTDCFNTEEKKKKHLCPKRLAAAATTCFDWGGLDGSDAAGFKVLLDRTGAKEDALFTVLKKLVFAKGPSRDSFIAELAHSHLPQLKWCQLPQARAEFVVRGLLEMVESASSLSSQDPARHYVPLNGNGDTNPQLQAKCITLEEFILKSRELAGPTFRYKPSLTTSKLARTSKGLKRFKKKLSRGGLEHYADTLRNQMLSAEPDFYDLATRDPEGEAQLAQIKMVVQAECDEAHLRASNEGKKPFGKSMMIAVQDRLRRMANEESHKVHERPYEALMGMVGVLTDNCPVWWSEKFNLEDQP